MCLYEGGRGFFGEGKFRELSLTVINGGFASLGMHQGGIKEIPTS